MAETQAQFYSRAARAALYLAADYMRKLADLVPEEEQAQMNADLRDMANQRRRVEAASRNIVLP